MNRRRVTIDLRRPTLRLHFGVRPTIVIDGVSQPTQWGVGTWLVEADGESGVDVFLFAKGHTFGRAHSALGGDALTYVAPRLPFGGGRFVN
ncbi:hypothetical protein QMG83_09740 [Salinibacterium sp. G-O1]|uniref:hypothetical protein n=1 Tax=Salinibacterium sp. G-O1 TaxID=3046208 RepID=UPI0024BB52DF|nr:hypothetical protein [Salinibacterium sp. G-O1]MDJ0335504.1 hypothetical protein [Salinibacterium sp. G-O1]